MHSRDALPVFSLFLAVFVVNTQVSFSPTFSCLMLPPRLLLSAVPDLVVAEGSY